MNKRILISGASGFVGSELKKYLVNKGCEVWSLSRHEERSDQEIYWDINKGHIDPIPDCHWDAVVHLAGEPILGYWTKKKKERIIKSRVEGTQLLVKAMEGKDLDCFISASGISYYPNTNEIYDENGVKGESFLSDVVEAWEDASKAIENAGVRRALMRISMVLDPKGGPLEAMLKPFKMGLGAVMGNGEQYISWITLQDLLRVIFFTINETKINGVVNCCGKEAVTNKLFSKTLATVLNKPCILPAPAFALKLIMGELAHDTMLYSSRIHPGKLIDAGFDFDEKDLSLVLKDLIFPCRPW